VSGPLVELRGVGRTYPGAAPVHALADIDLTIDTGEFVALLGPSGSGKSTLLGLIGLLDRPTSGHLLLDGEEMGSASDAHRTHLRGRAIGFIFQQFHLISHLDAVGNVETALLYRGLRRKERRERALAALGQVGLAHRARHRPVDSANAARLMDLLEALPDTGRAVVLVTHDAELARRAPRSVRLLDGRIAHDTVVAPR
jgi:putative ABC transport system ATP-binding protein